MPCRQGFADSASVICGWRKGCLQNCYHFEIEGGRQPYERTLEVMQRHLKSLGWSLSILWKARTALRSPSSGELRHRPGSQAKTQRPARTAKAGSRQRGMISRTAPILTRSRARRPRSIQTWRNMAGPIRSYGRGYPGRAGDAEPAHVRGLPGGGRRVFPQLTSPTVPPMAQ